MKPKKQIPVKPFLSLIKDLKEGRAETQYRVSGFKKELIDKINDNNLILQKAGENSVRIEELKHLLKMYKVNDEHKIFDLWHLETACGITKLPFMAWKDAFEKTEAGKPLKDTIGT